ncbi:MAG: valine--tRNA ligase [Vampirovibrionales bacterium]|nr:valine--tRNA ligase [Vampirovibrionales bacterium]
MLDKTYDPRSVEAELYAYWENAGLFKPDVADPQARPFSIVIPPPNVTGALHMGHALDNVLQDALTRWRRMQGCRALWMPGTDHAGIATQSVVERQLKAEGLTRQGLGREAFLARVWQWANSCKGGITGQLRRLGVSPDWSRERFTLDEGCSRAVRQAFYALYQRGLIYRGEYIVNWDPVSQSAISDIETEYADEDSFLWEVAYPVVGASGKKLIVATTRPETLYGDAAVAVHPEDPRYQELIGKQVLLPLTGKTIPIIADDYVDMAFGTGALKITPAHDPNDYRIGVRHQLEPVNVIDEKGALRDLPFIPEPVRGLDRDEARRLTEELLQTGGYLARKLPHRHRVGRAQRSGAVIEPLLSTQWFVKTAPLAQDALAALERGEIRFIPERWTRDYLRWMTNIQDWCISRQLWWGHQIPAWHCASCAQTTVAIEDPDVCGHCGSSDIRQDEDVLDTWFSSGLWPFSTMGWPNEAAPDYQTYYPTDVLVTGFDIIFFWVARMTMFAHALTGRSPFHTVYIHGLIRDEKGQKMSKSKGNTVDPVKAIEQYGCDGFRFGLLSLVTYGAQDIKLAPDKLELGKVFANKLWNAARFTLMNLEGVDDAPIDRAALSGMDRWILSRYHRAVAEANQLLEEYKFGELAALLYEFIWNGFCDWYVEYAKTQLRDPARATNARRILLTLLNGLLRLIHPVMPFISEAIWRKLPHTPTESVSIAPYPQADGDWIDARVTDDVELTLAVVRAARNIRQQYNLPPAAAIRLMIEAPDARERQALADNRDILDHFLKLESLTMSAALSERPSHAAANVVGAARILVPLEGLIDVAQELTRLGKKLEALKDEQDALYQMLGNFEFLERAPQAVVDKNKARLSEVKNQAKLLEEQLASLSA